MDTRSFDFKSACTLSAYALYVAIDQDQEEGMRILSQKHCQQRDVSCLLAAALQPRLNCAGTHTVSTDGSPTGSCSFSVTCVIPRTVAGELHRLVAAAALP